MANKAKISGKKCRISGRSGLVGNRVSHSKRRTKHKQELNLQWKWFYDEERKKRVRIRVSTKMIKTIDKKGLATVLRQYGSKV